MYPIPPNEHLVETKVCKHCRASFPITDKDMEFYEKVSPVFGGKKYSIPTPTLCPDCRQQRRLSFRNERKLYKRKCDATGKDIVSIYSPEKPYTVYHQDYWWGDAWNPMSYGREFDFTRGFFEQFRELMREVPKASLSAVNNQNSEYCHNTRNSINSYLSFGCTAIENVHYSTIVFQTKNSIDTNFSVGISESMEVIDSSNIEACFYISKCHHSSFLYHCFDLIGCHNCLFCIGLRNQNYQILNQQFTEESYKKELIHIIKNKEVFNEYLQKFGTLKKQSVYRGMHQMQCENSTGAVIMNCKEVYETYDSMELEKCKFINNSGGGKDCYDVYGLNKFTTLSYEGVEIQGANIICSWNCLSENRDLWYCMNCHNNCHNCFFCSGLRNKSYCILNKQYTKVEYEELVPKIIEKMIADGEWGEFFPASFSPFGYNETVAQEYFPLSRKEVLENPPSPPGSSPGKALGQGGNETFLHGPIFNWSDYEPPFPTVEKIIPGSKLPDSIESIPDDILNWAIECEVTKKPFRIIKQELEFYRKHNLPIPRRHPDQRHLDRMALRNPRKLFERKCDKCGKDMITSYSPEREEIVYCEECYRKDVVG